MRAPYADQLAGATERVRGAGIRAADLLQLGAHRRRGFLPVQVVVVALLVAFALAEGYLVVGKSLDAPGFGMLGRDAELYIEATRRWLGGGPFYLPAQLAGPYDLPWGQILYPPQALALFIPFTLLGTALFILIPLVVTAAVILALRPRFWARAAILTVLVFDLDAPLP